MLRKYNNVVLVFRKLACVLVAAMFLALPLFLCALPGVEMSEEEMACCREMADQCGDSSMPVSHSCCKTSASAHAAAFQIKQRDSSPPDMSAQVVVAAHVPPQYVPVVSFGKRVFDCPESPPGHTFVLRI